jgi:hypothetical protein
MLPEMPTSFRAACRQELRRVQGMLDAGGADTPALVALANQIERALDGAIDREPTRFEQVAAEIGSLLVEKNQAYGNAFIQCGDFLKLLYPDGIQPDQYGDALLLARIFDKMARIATKKDAFGESPYRDLAGYGILGAMKDEGVNDG